MKRKLLSDLELHDKYSSKMQEYVDNGYASLISNSKLAPESSTWYLPHQCTEDENAPGSDG